MARGGALAVAAPPATLSVIGASNTTNKVAGPVGTGPTGTGTIRTPLATVAALQAAITASQPGDIVKIADGSYSGDVFVAIAGTAANHIVIRPLNAGQVTWASGHWTFNSSSYIDVEGIIVTASGAGQYDLIHVTYTAHDIRINGWAFNSAGSGDTMSSVGLIHIDGDSTWTGYGDGFSTAPRPIPVVRNVLIDECSFTSPKNGVLWVNHGCTGVKFTHNTITGPHSINTGETEAIKFGYGVGWYEHATGCYVAFNTISNWDGSPYVIGIKMSGVSVVGNLLTKGRIEIRAAGSCRVIGNVIEDGDLHWGGSNNEVAKNYIKTTNGVGGFGPMMIYVTAGFAPYIGVTSDWFYVAGSISLVRDNILWNNTTPGGGTQGLATLMTYCYYTDHDVRPNGNTFLRNRLYGNNSADNVVDSGTGFNTATMIAANTWLSNNLAASTTPTNVLGGNNTVSDSDVDIPPAAPSSISLTSDEVSYTTARPNVSWQTLPLGAGGWITGLDLQGTEKLARTDTYGLYRWDSKTGKWAQLVTSGSVPSADVLPNSGFGVYEAVIAPSDTTTYYAAWNGSVYKSTNHGETWTKTALTGKTFDANDNQRMFGPKMAVDPYNASVVYIGIPSDGLYVTTDGGTSWSAVSSSSIPVANASGYVICFDAMGGQQRAGGGYQAKRVWVISQGHGAYRSVDCGATWTSTTGGPVSARRIVCGNDGDAGTDSRIYVSSDDSAKYLYRWASGAWSVLITDANLAPHSIAVEPTSQAHVIAFRSGLVAMHSTNNGTSWGSPCWSQTFNASDIPWIGDSTSQSADGEVVYDPSVSGRIWAGMGVGVCYADVTSSDTSTTWHSQSIGIEQLVVNDIVRQPSGPLIVGCADRCIFALNDFVNYPAHYYPDNTFRACWDVDVAGDGKIVAVNTWADYNKAGYSFNGTSWTSFGSIPAGKNNDHQYGFGCIAVDPANSNNIVWVGYADMPYYSTDGGATWTVSSFPGGISAGMLDGSNFFISNIWVQRKIVTCDAMGNFYIQFSAPGNTTTCGFYRSTNHGATWTKMVAEPSNNTLPLWEILHWGNYNTTLVAAPGTVGDLWVGAGQQGSSPDSMTPSTMPLMRSTDGGATWSSIANVAEPYHFGFGAPKPGGSGYPTIYMIGWVSNVYGVWRSTDTATTWTNIGTWPNGSLSGPNCVRGDMDHYGWVYVGLGGQGAVWRDTSSL